VTIGIFEFTTTAAPAVDPANTGITVLPVGADVRVILTDIVSLFTPRNPWVTLFVRVAEEPVAQVVVAEVRVNVSDCGTAFEGATERRPKPIAATVTSAMRLKVVFVDIYILSISRFSDDPRAGLGSKFSRTLRKNSSPGSMNRTC
jgi:hypothetical protein